MSLVFVLLMCECRLLVLNLLNMMEWIVLRCVIVSMEVMVFGIIGR